MAFPDILSRLYFGNTILQYLIFFGYLAGGIILGKIIYYITTGVMRQLTKKTKTKFDDILIDIMEEPLVFFIVVLSFFMGSQQLTLSEAATGIFAHITRGLTTIAFAWFLVRFIDSVIINYVTPLTQKTESDLDDHLMPIVRKVVKFIIIGIATIMVLDNMGYDVTSVVAGLGIGGLAFALAAQDLLKNLFGGITIIMDRPFKLGQWIEIGGLSGEVVEIGLRSTRLKTATKEFITVPNSFFADKGTINHKNYNEKAVIFTLGLDYNTSAEKIRKAKEIVKNIISGFKLIDKESIQCSFINFGAYTYDIEVRFAMKTNDATIVRNTKDEINLAIKEQFEKSKIEFAYPTQTLYVRK